MGFRAITIRGIGDRDEPFAYPITDEQCNLIEERWDHGLGRVITASGIWNYYRVSGEKVYTEGLKVGDVDISFYVTDSRVAILCNDYDHGDGSLYERYKGKKRSAGKVLLGHIRYEWLTELEYLQKESLLYSWKKVRLLYTDGDRTSFMTDVVFSKGTDTAFIANDILHRCCLYRLAMTDKEEQAKQKGAIEFFEKYSSDGKIAPANDSRKDFSTIKIPYSYLAPGGHPFRPGTQKHESEA